MNEFLDRVSKLSPKRLALLALELNDQLEAASAHAHEPIAIVGMACRFPGGAHDPQAFWQLLREGRDAIVEVPRDRWDIDRYFDPAPDAPGRMSVRTGGFIHDIDKFDPGFFGISPREALTMDPQQRLLLEVSWQALEYAGIAPEGLAGSAAGVFVGICNTDYSHRVLGRGTDTIDAYLASGNAYSVAAGRISYTLGLQGPALAIDTACSSSLVALHIACLSLRAGGIDLALCGGVNVICAPETMIALSKGHMLAPDGRCKTFDARADGFARGEGCGVIVLKRLSDARAAGDTILAVIRGTASNQDGRSGGLTVPNGPAQEAVIRAALTDAGLEPHAVGYVEAHGTGTSLGDPIEIRALAGAYSAGHTAADPLLVGSVKTNIGHLESAAGIAGVIKVVLMLQHRLIPRHLHFQQPSPHIAWQDYPIEVTAREREWPRHTERMIAGVSSFGFSGTNAHILIEQAPDEPVATSDAAHRVPYCLPLSAQTPAALRELATRYALALRELNGTALGAFAQSAAIGRSHFAERAAVVTDSATAAADALQELAAGRAHAAIQRGTVVPGRPLDVVFLFTGQGSQYPGMARGLYGRSEVFRGVIDRCDEALGTDARGHRLKDVLWPADPTDAAVHETAWTQPALFAVEYGVAEVWRSWGVEPAAVIGHSVGEYVAACVAGVFPLEDGLRLIAERGRLMQALPPGGSMAAIFAPAELVAAAVAPLRDRVAIAAFNAPDSVVISGAADAVEQLLADFAKRNVQGHRLFVSLAAHSPLVEPALEAMERCAASVTMHAPRVPIAWNVTGGALADGAAPDAVYWRRHLREPVLFAAGLSTLYADGFRNFLEVGPHPTLLALTQRTLPESDTCLLTSLRRGKDDWRELMTSVAEIYARGAALDWRKLGEAGGRTRVPVPTYPFERRSFWIPSPDEVGDQRLSWSGHTPGLDPARVPTMLPIFETLLRPDSPAWLGEHQVGGAALVAGPVLLEIAQRALRRWRGKVAASVGQFAIESPLVLPPEGRRVQLQLVAEQGGAVRFSVYSAPVGGADEWTAHAAGVLDDHQSSEATSDVPVKIPDAAWTEVGGAAHYERLACLGIGLGAGFRSLRSARRRDGEAIAVLTLAEKARREPVAWVHPVLLDGAIQAVGLAVPDLGTDSEIYLLAEIERLELQRPIPGDCNCHVIVHADSVPRPAQWRADVELTAPEGTVLGTIRGVKLKRAPREMLARLGPAAPVDASDLHYVIEWQDAEPGGTVAPQLLSPTEFAPSLRASFTALVERNGMEVYGPLLEALDRLSLQHVADALRTLGFESGPGRRFTLAAEAARLRIVARHTRLFERLLGMLEEAGALRRDGGEFTVLAPLPAASTIDPYPQLLARFAPVDGELLTLQRCGPHLASVLDGRQEPLQLLFPGGSLTEARKLYVESPFARTYNAGLAEALSAALPRIRPGARLRVLEVGAGTGGTTTYVLPLLPPEQCEYTFTDVSPMFLERAAEQYRECRFLHCALLDIERDPATQGFEPGAYDVVIAANALHATSDLRTTVNHVARLLARGGLLLLIEGTAPQRWVDLTFGLTEGWWRFADASLRPCYPLIGRDAWVSLLQDAGFGAVEAVPATRTTQGYLNQQILMIARAPGHVRDFTIVGDPNGLGTAVATKLRARGDQARCVSVSDDVLPATGDIVYLGALPLAMADPSTQAARDAAHDLAAATPLRLLTELSKRAVPGRIWFVTQGVHALPTRPTPGATLQAPLLGIGRGAALEKPEAFGALIDLPVEPTCDELAETLVEGVDRGGVEDQLAYRGTKWQVPRLARSAAPPRHSPKLRSDATYMVTGGLGGLGVVVARWLIAQGARHLALLGRSASQGADAVRELQRLGATVTTYAVDVPDDASAFGD